MSDQAKRGCLQHRAVRVTALAEPGTGRGIHPEKPVVPTRRLALSHPDEGTYEHHDNPDANPKHYVATSLSSTPLIPSYHGGASQACCSSPTRRLPLVRFAYVTPNDGVLARADFAAGVACAGLTTGASRSTLMRAAQAGREASHELPDSHSRQSGRDRPAKPSRQRRDWRASPRADRTMPVAYAA